MNYENYRIEKIKNGDPIVSEDAWPYYAYVILSGKAKVLTSDNNHEDVIGHLKEGDVVGELATIGNTRRVASVIAESDMEVQMVSKDAILDIMKNLSTETRSKLDIVTGDLAQTTQISTTLSHLVHEIRDLNKKVVNSESLKKELLEEIKDVPEVYKRIFTTLIERRCRSMETLKKLRVELEKTLVGECS